MSLISQNSNLGKKRERINNENENINEADENLLNHPEERPKSLKSKKRKNKENRKNNEKSRDDEKEMIRLKSNLFGSIYNPPEFGKENEVEENVKPLFFEDKSTGDEMIVYEEDLGEKVEKEDETEERKPVWFDEEEERAEIDIIKARRLRKLRKVAGEEKVSGEEYVARLRAQHEKLNPGTEWAKIGRKNAGAADSDDEDIDGDRGVMVADGYDGNEILRSNEELVVKSNVRLLPGLLEYSRLTDANREEPSNAVINSVQFHRNGQLLLTGGLDKKLRFFQVDGKRNTKVESIFIEDCPIHKASFLDDGSQVIISGRRKFFYSFDLVKSAIDKIGPLAGREEKSYQSFEVSPDSKVIAFTGEGGCILLVSTKTKQLIDTFKMSGDVRSLTFVDNGNQLISGGTDGHIYHWDMRTRRCIHKAVDEGCIIGTSLCASPDSNLFAAGSSSGIVNVYKRDEFLGGKRKPVKAIENLTTHVTYMKFNHDAQILAICSNVSNNGLKLVHVPSFNVFSNWPPPRANLHKPRCLDFSPGGGFMAYGNAAGKVILYKLHHYEKA